MKKKFTSLFIAAAMALTLCACGNSDEKPQDADKVQTSDGATVKTETDDSTTSTDSNTTDADKEKQDDGTQNTGSIAGQTVTDPSGVEVTIPKQVDSIVVLAPGLSEIVTGLGIGDKVVGYDTYSAGIEGLPEDASTFDTTNPDVEKLAALDPDVLLTTNLTLYDQESPYQPLIDAGTCVICVPSSDDIEGIKNDIEFLSSALGASEAGDTMLEDLNSQLNELADIAASIPKEERKRVYFEIAPAPNMYSFGSQVYLNEMLEWIGAENILADQQGWVTVEGETVVAANPDVIFTNVSYTDDPVQEILDRDGWAGISAIADKNVYYIDNNASSQPNQNIIKAMRQMAEILYPDYYKK